MSMTVPPVARRPTRGQKVVPALATSENSFWVFGRDAGEAGMARPSTLILGEVRAFRAAAMRTTPFILSGDYHDNW